jgi:glutaconyl-CoA/methylmalonyl-CoA decarboxylase subunit gamma
LILTLEKYREFVKEDFIMKKFNITVNGQAYEVEVAEVGGAAPAAPAARPAAAAPAAAPAPAAAATPVPAGAKTITAPMPGKVLSVAVKAGQAVKKGDILLVLEAMKMANEITCPADGTVADVRVAAGQMVKVGEVLIVL